jgi:hypothetical protein
MQRLPAAEICPCSLDDDGDPVPAYHQADVSQTGNVRSTKTEANVRRVAPWHAREVMEMMPVQFGEPYPLHGATTCSCPSAAAEMLRISVAPERSRWAAYASETTIERHAAGRHQAQHLRAEEGERLPVQAHSLDPRLCLQ